MTSGDEQGSEMGLISYQTFIKDFSNILQSSSKQLLVNGAKLQLIIKYFNYAILFQRNIN